MVMNQAFFQIINILFIIFWLITILFSITTIIVILYHWRTQCRSIVNLLTCNSCIGLIFYIITLSIQMPLSLQRIYFDIPEPNPFLCKIYACLGTVGTGVIACSFMIQAISRFFVTILYKHKFLLTFRTNWIMIITSWIASGIIAGGLYISPLAYRYEPESHFCTLTTKNFLTSFLASIIIVVGTMIIMIILYGIILYHVVRHTRINPDSPSALRVKRNKKVFQRIFIFVGIFGFGGMPYFICTMINRTDPIPWPLYSLVFLFISFAAAINSVMLLFTNDQVKDILLRKLTGRQKNLPNNTKTIRINQILPYSIKMRTVQILPIID